MPGGRLVQLEGRLRHLVDAEAPVGAGNGEAAVLEFYVVFGGFEDVGRELLALGDDLLARHNDGSPAHGGRARATGAHTEGDRIGVALDEFHLLGIDTEPVHQYLRLHGGVALAVRDRAGHERNSAERVEADFGGFDGRIGGEFDGVGDADAA
jgi:hypothetical protein